MRPDREIDEAIIDDYKRVSSTLEQLSLPMWLKLGLSMPQLKALVAVIGAEEITVTGLGCELSIGQPSASLLVDQLVQRGYAQRRSDPADRRRVIVTATAAGRELLEELRHGRRQTLEDWLAGVDDEDAAALARGLHALAEAATRSAERK